MLKEAMLRLSRVALLVNPDSQISRRYIEAAQAAAPALGLTIRTFEVRLLDEFGAAFDEMAKATMQAVSINADGLIYQAKEMLAKLALARRMAVMSYGPDNVQATHRAAALVDKILKGAKPGDLPVEQPTKFEMGINLKAAKTLGLTIPQSVLVRADHLIQ